MKIMNIKKWICLILIASTGVCSILYAQDPVAIFKRNSNSVVRIYTSDDISGTGFFVDSNIIVTNYHVVKNAFTAFCSQDTSSIPYIISGYIAIDSLADLVLLKVENSNNKALPLSNLNLNAGQGIYVIGCPHNQPSIITIGSVNGLNNGDHHLIQFSASVSEGSSGSPVFDAKEKVVGVVVGYDSSGQNRNFAIPIEYVQKLLGLHIQSAISFSENDLPFYDAAKINIKPELNEFSIIQKFWFTLFSDKTSRALKQINKNNNCSKAELLLAKTKKDKMIIAYSIAKALCLEKRCTSSVDCDTNCKYKELRDYYKTAHENFASISKRELFALLHYQSDYIPLDSVWIKEKYNSFNKYFAERALQVFGNNYFSLLDDKKCTEIQDYLNCSDIICDSTEIYLTVQLAKALYSEQCGYDIGKKTLCLKYSEIDTLLKTQMISENDKEVLARNNIDIYSLIRSKVDSLCTRRTVLALREAEHNASLFNSDYTKMYYYLLKAREWRHDSVELPRSYFSAWATYYNNTSDSARYCLYHELAANVNKSFSEDLSVMAKYKNCIIDSSCERIYYAVATRISDTIKKYDANRKTVLNYVNNIKIGDEPLVTYFKKMKFGETVIVTEIPIWASSDFEIGEYKNSQIDNALVRYCDTMVSFIHKYSREGTQVSLYILGTADSHPVDDLIYDNIIDNLSINYFANLVLDTCDINNVTYYVSDSIKTVTGGIKFRQPLTDIDLAYLRALNFLTIFNKQNDLIKTEERKIFIHDYDDALKLLSPAYRKLQAVFVIKNIVFKKEDVSKIDIYMDAIKIWDEHY
jgi:hypothetical protein